MWIFCTRNDGILSAIYKIRQLGECFAVDGRGNPYPNRERSQLMENCGGVILDRISAQNQGQSLEISA
jgi:hypothetical protein